MQTRAFWTPRSSWHSLAVAFMATAACLLIGGATAAHAQDKDTVVSEDYGVEVKKPDGWKVESGNEKAVAVFTHPDTQSQIEIVPTKLMTADVADVFFNTFHKTLTESNFEKDGEGKEETIGDVKGTHTVYKFTHSGVNLKVHVFSFVRETTAWLAVGYMQDQEEENRLKDFKWTVKNMEFTKEK